MTKLILAPVVAVALALGAGAETKTAKADDFGFHIAGPGYHLDIGRTHGHRYRSYRAHRAHIGHGHGHGHGWGRGYGRVWHDTSHLHYHSGGLVPHYDHYHYVPGHWDVHHTGHWDHW